MLRFFNRILDALSEFLSQRKGLLPAIGILLIISNWGLQFIAGGGIIAESNLLLHLGVITAIIGFMLAWAL
jgi:hypothetical protein